MDTNRISQMELPPVAGIYIPISEGRLSAPRVAQIYFETEIDRTNFHELAKQGGWDFKCTLISSSDKGLKVFAVGHRNIVDVFRRIYGWESVDSRTRYQFC